MFENLSPRLTVQTVVIEQQPPVNHPLHLCVSLFFLPWIVVWIILVTNHSTPLRDDAVLYCRFMNGRDPGTPAPPDYHWMRKPL